MSDAYPIFDIARFPHGLLRAGRVGAIINRIRVRTAG